MLLCICVRPIRVVHHGVSSNQNGSSWVVPPGEQFVCIVLEFTEYYKEKCTWHFQPTESTIFCRGDKNSDYYSTLSNYFLVQNIFLIIGVTLWYME